MGSRASLHPIVGVSGGVSGLFLPTRRLSVVAGRVVLPAVPSRALGYLGVPAVVAEQEHGGQDQAKTTK